MQIYNNPIAPHVIRKAKRKQRRYLKRFGNDLDTRYHLKASTHPLLTPTLNVQLLVPGETPWEVQHPNPIIIGNIRMGFGHYRIAIALASCAQAMGYTPYWFDLLTFKETTGAKIINHLNSLYSLGSRLSQKWPLFDRWFWEPISYHGFRHLNYNASDLIIASCFAPIFNDISKDIPFVGTHVWPAQAAISAKLKKVINIVPDNWPLALHLAPGSIHTTQTHSATIGYALLKGFNGKKVCHPMDAKDIRYCGHYVDHELVTHIKVDTEQRLHRIHNKQPKRLLFTIGGAGAQSKFYAQLLLSLKERITAQEIICFVNVGDHKHVWDNMLKEAKELAELAITHHKTWDSTMRCIQDAHGNKLMGMHVFYHEDIIEAVYSTNVLMRESDILVTKPSELSFYPIPKCFIKRVGGHEMWGAIHSSELGDGTIECESVVHATQMLTYLLEDANALITMNKQILKLNDQEVYHGAYKAIALCQTSMD